MVCRRTICLNLAAVVGSVAALPATATSSCITASMTANFDDLPTGTLDPSTNYLGLSYEGWEVVRASDTPFKAPTKPNILRMTGKVGVIRAAESGTLFNDIETQNTSGDFSFFFGCANKTSSSGCEFTKLYGVPCNFYGCTPPGPTFDLLFNSTEYSHNLEKAIGDEPSNQPNITWTLYDVPKSTHLYIDEYKYYVTDCS